jgi:hypothetical protein
MADLASNTGKTGWLRFFSHPAVGITASSCSIVSVPLAVLLYQHGIRAPELTLCLHPIRTPIVQKALASDISVSFKGQAVTGDMTAAQFAIWNAGREPIRSEAVLKPLVILTADQSPIYEASLQKIVRDFTAVRLDTRHLTNGASRN